MFILPLSGVWTEIPSVMISSRAHLRWWRCNINFCNCFSVESVSQTIPSRYKQICWCCWKVPGNKWGLWGMFCCCFFFFSVPKDSFVSFCPSPLSTHEGNYSTWSWTGYLVHGPIFRLHPPLTPVYCQSPSYSFSTSTFLVKHNYSLFPLGS